MLLTWMLHKIKTVFLIFLNLFKRALCCIRKRKHSYSEAVPLTHVVSNTDCRDGVQTWSDWGDENDKPKTVQDYINLYRQQTSIKGEVEEEKTQEQLNFFEDMAPKITRQTKVLVSTKNDMANNGRKATNRLNFVEDTVNVIPSAELGEWEETSGWEGEHLGQEAQKVLREQKRLERERRAWEQHQKRLEKTTRSLGSKLSA